MSEIEQIRERFRSGNNVPVPDIRLSRKEWGAVESALTQARAEERERCAKVCEDEAELASLMVKVDALNVAADRIRALSDERAEK